MDRARLLPHHQLIAYGVADKARVFAIARGR